MRLCSKSASCSRTRQLFLWLQFFLKHNYCISYTWPKVIQLAVKQSYAFLYGQLQLSGNKLGFK